MNRQNISTNNFSIPAVLAVALTASTSPVSNLHSASSPIIPPYYLSNTNYISEEKFLNTTTTNILDVNQVSADEDHYNLLINFGESIISRSIDLDPNISKIIDDNFWDLI